MPAKKGLIVSALCAVFCLGLLYGPAPASAQSITAVNHTSCIIWIQVKNNQGKWAYARNLTPNAMYTKGNAGGSGITAIMAGPTCAVDSCCYRRKVNLSLGLSGETWRVDIYSDRLELFNGDGGNWTQKATGSGGLGNCAYCNKSGMGASSTGLDTPKGY